MEKIIGVGIILSVALIIIIVVTIFIRKQEKKKAHHLNTMVSGQHLKVKRKDLIYHVKCQAVYPKKRIILTDRGIFSYDEVVVC